MRKRLRRNHTPGFKAKVVVLTQNPKKPRKHRVFGGAARAVSALVPPLHRRASSRSAIASLGG